VEDLFHAALGLSEELAIRPVYRKNQRNCAQAVMLGEDAGGLEDMKGLAQPDRVSVD
jgi:hypothetical protein